MVSLHALLVHSVAMPTGQHVEHKGRLHDAQRQAVQGHGYLNGSELRPWRNVRPLRCRDDIVLLANQLGLRGVAAEIGVWAGAFAAKNLASWQGEHYWMIDAWGHRNNDSKRVGELSDNNEEDVHHLKRMNSAATITATWASKRTLLRSFSVPAASQFEDNSLDWIYVDALHTQYAVDQDLIAWWPKLKVGGMMSGDDFADKGEPGYSPRDAPNVFSWGVRTAVGDFAARVGEQVYITGDKGCDHGSPAWYAFKTRELPLAAYAFPPPPYPPSPPPHPPSPPPPPPPKPPVSADVEELRSQVAKMKEKMHAASTQLEHLELGVRSAAASHADDIAALRSEQKQIRDDHEKLRQQVAQSKSR